MPVCPRCAEDLVDDARACPSCRHDVPAWVMRPVLSSPVDDGAARWLTPLRYIAVAALLLMTFIVVALFVIPHSRQ
jgi:hypothetical protein